MYAGGGSGTPATLEAENARLSLATVATNHTGFTGSGFVDYGTVSGGYIEWTVNASSAGSKTLGIRYANGSTKNRALNVTINGGSPVTVDVNPTTDWDTWQLASLTAQLKAGANTVRATATTSTGGPNVDSLLVD